MRHIMDGPQDVPDSVTGTHRHTRRKWTHRQPGPQLAIQPRVHIRRVCLHAIQSPRQQIQTLGCLRVAVGVGQS